MSDITSKFTKVCFDCRYTTKSQWVGAMRCPHCQKPLENVGKHFRVPPKKDRAGWVASERYFRGDGTSAQSRLASRLEKQWAARRSHS